MKRSIACLALALPLALPGAAASKEFESAKVCGASDCRTFKDHRSLMALSRGGPAANPPKATPFYRVEVTMRGDGEMGTFENVIVPDAAVLRGGTATDGYSWWEVPPEVVSEYRRITRGLEPIPAAELDGLEPRQAKVDDVVVVPTSEPEPTESSLAWPWIVSLLGGAALLVVVLTRAIRSRA